MLLSWRVQIWVWSTEQVLYQCTVTVDRISNSVEIPLMGGAHIQYSHNILIYYIDIILAIVEIMDDYIWMM